MHSRIHTWGRSGCNAMKKVIVASTNPVKIEAAQIGFDRMFPDESFDVQGASAPSEVSAQPMSSDETLLGATNRAENASKFVTDADYWIGIEGGIENVNEELEVFAWVVVKAANGKIGKGKTGSFFLPQKIAELVRQGVELGEADDIVFGRKNSKQANGAIGILTDDALTRTTYYEPAVIMALIPFKNLTLY
jgi:inosine/xanthosine triphosphatase